jgi:hypothetical protein
MALNFNLLAQEGPKNFYEGFEQGRQAVAQNALAQQKLAQEGEMMSMRRQEFQANLESSRAERRRKATVEKTAMFRDRILRAPTPQAARELVRMQHSDPDLGPVMQQLGSLDQDLADIPDDPTGFENWRQREAMGAAEFIKSQASERGFQDLLARVRGGQQGAAVAPAMPSSAPGAMAAPAELAAGAQPEPMAPVPGVISTSRVPGVTTAPISMPAAAGEGVRGIVPAVNTLAPPAAAPVNAMLAAQPAGRGRTPEQIRAEIDQLSMSSVSNDPRVVRMVQTLMKEYEAALKPDPSELRTMRELGYPLTQAGYASFRAAQMKDSAPPSMVAEYNFARSPDGGGFKGSYQDFVTARAAAGRAPAAPRQEPAPTLDTVVDPNNPNQMLRIDVRRYSPGGSVGSPGVIGISGKEPGAAVRENKTEAGKTQLADDLENLRASFLVLDQKRAIPSTERGVLSNIASATAASGVGQMLGRATGTTEQVEREVINSARTRLVNSIKNATGMSAQQLNSNVELQTMLKSISDPAQPVQAALRIIEDIENAYVKGAGMPKKNAPARSLTPQDQEALNWANSNPNDPRAAQIKQRLGAK